MPDTEISTPKPVSSNVARTIVTSHKGLVEVLLKHHDIHDGIWGLYVKFGRGASNVGENEQNFQPAAIIPVLEIGLQQYDKETNLSVNAARVNPRPNSA